MMVEEIEIERTDGSILENECTEEDHHELGEEVVVGKLVDTSGSETKIFLVKESNNETLLPIVVTTQKENSTIDTNESSVVQINGQSTEVHTQSLPQSTLPTFRSEGLHSYLEVVSLLNKLNNNDPRLIRVPPSKPIAPGQVYIYALQPGQSPYDWRFDGFQWINLRANIFPKKNANPILTRHEFRLLDRGTKVDFFRHEYHEPGHSFKTPINIEDWKWPYIVIHYFGNFPVNEAQMAPHAGRRPALMGGLQRRSRIPKNYRAIETPTNQPNSSLISLSSVTGNTTIVTVSSQESGGGDEPSTSNQVTSEISIPIEQSEQLISADPTAGLVVEQDEAGGKRRKTDPDALDVYGATVLEVENGKVIDLNQLTLLTVNGIEVNGPNLKHRGPSISQTRKGTKPTVTIQNLLLTKDDLYGCYVFNEMTKGQVIRLLNFTNGPYIVIAEHHLVSHVNNLSTADFLEDVKLTFTYQATAKLYRFLVTTLFIKHPLFENEPYIPIAVFLHRTHSFEAHSAFFHEIKELCPIINNNEITLIVANEVGVTEAIESELTSISTIHITEGSGNIGGVVPVSPRISAAKLDFLLVSVAKSLNFDHIKMIHLIYFLQCHYFNEIIKCLVLNVPSEFVLQGRYFGLIVASPNLAERVLSQNTFNELLEDGIGPNDIISMLTKSPPQVVGQGSDYEMSSQNELQLFEGLAHFYIAKDRIDWIKTKGHFTVKGIANKEYIVKLSGRTCSCPRGKACEHVLSVLIATGILSRQQ